MSALKNKGGIKSTYNMAIKVAIDALFDFLIRFYRAVIKNTALKSGVSFVGWYNKNHSIPMCEQAFA